jgi:hypothetical protein
MADQQRAPDADAPDGAQAAPAPDTSHDPNAGVDVAQVADKVYRLLLADLRLSLARGERLAWPGRGRN